MMNTAWVPGYLSRRQFVRAVGVGSIVVLGGCGQFSQPEQPAKVHRLGVLTYGTPAANERDNLALRQGLLELGYDDRNLALEYRGAEWQPERLPGLAAELIGLNVEVIVAMGGDVARAAMQATTTIPIVFSSSGDAVPALVPSSPSDAG